jgi:hypothetical protein
MLPLSADRAPGCSLVITTAVVDENLAGHALPHAR